MKTRDAVHPPGDDKDDETEVWIEDYDGSLAPTGEFMRDGERPGRLIRRMIRSRLIGDTPGWRWSLTRETGLDDSERRAVLRQDREPVKPTGATQNSRKRVPTTR